MTPLSAHAQAALTAPSVIPTLCALGAVLALGVFVLLARREFRQ
jgi:hypothetical protein